MYMYAPYSLPFHHCEATPSLNMSKVNRRVHPPKNPPLTPKTRKRPTFMPDAPAVNQGDDISGIVHAVGANVSEFRPGDRVAAFHEMMKPGGSYAEYALSWACTTFRLPEKTTFEGKHRPSPPPSWPAHPSPFSSLKGLRAPANHPQPPPPQKAPPSPSQQ